MAYDLAESIERAWYELDKTETPSFPQINLISRKYAPSTIKEIQEMLVKPENTWVLALKAEPGRLVEDVVAAAVAEWISDQLVYKLQEKAKVQLDKQKQATIQAQFETIKKQGKRK